VRFPSDTNGEDSQGWLSVKQRDCAVRWLGERFRVMCRVVTGNEVSNLADTTAGTGAGAVAVCAPCLCASRYFFGASMLKTSLRIVARTSGLQPRAAHLSKRTWAAIAKLSPVMFCLRVILYSCRPKLR